MRFQMPCSIPVLSITRKHVGLSVSMEECFKFEWKWPSRHGCFDFHFLPLFPFNFNNIWVDYSETHMILIGNGLPSIERIHQVLTNMNEKIM